MINFSCPVCGKPLVIEEQYAGKEARCPGCNRILTVPFQQPPPGAPTSGHYQSPFQQQWAPPPPPPPPQWGAPPPYYSPYEYSPYGGKSNGMAVASMVLGIVSFFVGCFSFITGPLAIIFGAVSISGCNKGTAEGKGMATAGLVCGIIAVALWVLLYLVAFSLPWV